MESSSSFPNRINFTGFSSALVFKCIWFIIDFFFLQFGSDFFLCNNNSLPGNEIFSVENFFLSIKFYDCFLDHHSRCSRKFSFPNKKKTILITLNESFRVIFQGWIIQFRWGKKRIKNHKCPCRTSFLIHNPFFHISTIFVLVNH